MCIHMVTMTVSHKLWCNYYYLFTFFLDWQESQAVPLTNINNVMAEANTGKTRRLHFQDELPAGTTENTAETGQAHTQTCTTCRSISALSCTETDPVLALDFCRWCKGQPFNQEAAIHLYAHWMHRWVTALDISDHQMPHGCINFLHRCTRYPNPLFSELQVMTWAWPANELELPLRRLRQVLSLTK